MRYYFIDREIYFQNEKMPDRKVELFDIEFLGDYVLGYDEDGNWYEITKNELIKEEEE